MRVVVLGGYGNFGARICRALARDGVEVVAASRHPYRGHRAAGFDASIGKARIDLSDSQLASNLRKLSPHIVIHCAGPFQAQDYRVAFATVEAGAHYVDLADGRSFVAQFAQQVEASAKAADRLAVSGASTVPALSSAVVDAIAHRFTAIEEIQTYIAPAQRAPRGAATMQAVFSYAGQRFMWWKDSLWQSACGWQELHRVRIDGLGTRWSAACDIPDLELFPARYPAARTVQFRAALEVGVQHFALAGVAQLRRWGLPIPLERWASTLDRYAGWLDRFGSENGGMLVSVVGTREDGSKCRFDWHLFAPNNHGPEIPCMPAILLAKKLLRGEIERRGALPCMGLLTLDEFAPEFARWGIETKLVETTL
jgi:hypothetical protein